MHPVTPPYLQSVYSFARKTENGHGKVNGLANCPPLHTRERCGWPERPRLVWPVGLECWPGTILEGQTQMRTLRALAFSALLLSATSASAFADDGGGYAIAPRPQTERLMEDGGGMARPSVIKGEGLNEDGGGMSVPNAPTAPAHDEDGYARWA